MSLDSLNDIMLARWRQHPSEFDELGEDDRVHCGGIITRRRTDGTTHVLVAHSATSQTLRQMRDDWSHALTCGYDGRTVRGFAWRGQPPYAPIVDDRAVAAS